MTLETILTVFMLAGIVALALLILYRAAHAVIKFLGNGLCGLAMLALVIHFGGAYGVDLSWNVFTVIFSLITGVFGVTLLTLFQILF